MHVSIQNHHVCMQHTSMAGLYCSCAGSTGYCSRYPDMQACCPVSCDVCPTNPPTHVRTHCSTTTMTGRHNAATGSDAEQYNARTFDCSALCCSWLTRRSKMFLGLLILFVLGLNMNYNPDGHSKHQVSICAVVLSLPEKRFSCVCGTVVVVIVAAAAVAAAVAVAAAIAVPIFSCTLGCTCFLATCKCADTCQDAVWWSDSDGDNCSEYSSCSGGYPTKSTEFYQRYAKNGVSALDACCRCGRSSGAHA